MIGTNPGTTQFVGGDLKDMPGISLFGAFARIVRLNHISPTGYHSGLSLRNRPSSDLSIGLTFGPGRKQVAASLGVTAQEALSFSQWLPFKCDEYVFEKNWVFRFCPACIRHGFHLYLQQLPWIERCPWHRCALRTSCRICDAALTLTSSTRLSLLVCRNGHDHFDEVSSCINVFGLEESARTFVGEYLGWAEEQRNHWTLMPPDASTTNWAVLASTVRLPPELCDRCEVTPPKPVAAHTRIFTVGAVDPQDISDVSSSFSKVSTVLNNSLGIELPTAYVRGFVKIACDLAEGLPPESLTDSEIHLFFDGLERQPDRSFRPAKRSSLSDITFLPPLLVGERRIVHLSSLSSRATSAVAQLIVSYQNVAAHDELSSEEDGKRLLLHATGEILKRAYAEGLRVILARYVPSLFDSKRNRPHLTEPWLLIQTIDGQLVEIQITWAKAKPPT